ncbi:peptidyl-prolyl cis-trans isomerase FKBP2 [Neodiprion virginianus]|uniref:peptidyl-prolyl cis-trans isomerase FKBP2 n=1 Tax=Neodiprion fabricii TaxID=2872261 RepID=UPI001ED8E94E|nr:peptidyl-prolyl cis-trans isomerase FKBP2 [Neodiprion fabricii]XP_046615928.1 peptidyl-prolyl cis-trans isomerase FKBP2 [Neodiprion virginianus]
MKSYLIFLGSVCLSLSLGANVNDGTKRKLQIGIKKRVDKCKVKSKKGDTLYVHYVGTLEDGTEIDSSYIYGEPLPVTLGYRQVIKGWEQGLMGMCEGEKRKLVIPPDLAYGTPGALPKVPPNATVIFIIELIKLVPKEELEEVDDVVIRDEL